MANPRRRTARMGSVDTRAHIAAAPKAPARKVTWKQKAQYKFDNTMSRGTSALVMWLGLVTVVLVALFALVVLIFQLGPENSDGSRDGIISQTFKTLLHALDP